MKTTLMMLAGLSLALLFAGCGKKNAALTTEQEQWVKAQEESFVKVKESATKVLEQLKNIPQPTEEINKVKAVLEKALADAQVALKNLRLQVGTWEERKAAIEKAVKELQDKITEATKAVGSASGGIKLPI